MNATSFTIQEIKNNVDVDEEMNKDLLLRQSRLLYPEVEDFILNIAIEAYINELKSGSTPRASD